jgi:energy-coupling factor transporter ATP-binding protein EcfA2
MDEAAQPFRLKRLEISNFRGIRHLALDFTDREGKPLDKILFVGPSGSGKTSIMRALATILGHRVGEKPHHDLREEYFGSFYFSLDAETTAGEVHLRDYQTGFGLTGGKVSVAVFLEGLPLDGRPVGRPDLREIEEKIVRAMTRRALGRGPLTGDLNDPIARIQALWTEIGGRPPIVDVLQDSNDPGSRFRVILREPGEIPADVTSLDMAVGLAIGSKAVPHMVTLDQLSAGEEMMLSYGTRLIFADRPFNVVLVDESEQHLHPRWHMKLPEIMRAAAPTAQFFFTSHSPYMVDQFAAHEVFLLNSTSKGIECARLDQHAEFEKWKGTLRTGEFWSYAGERWVGDVAGNREN